MIMNANMPTQDQFSSERRFLSKWKETFSSKTATIRMINFDTQAKVTFVARVDNG
jgi:hypothetical protein